MSVEGKERGSNSPHSCRAAQVLYVTERAVFKLTESGLRLHELAPGIHAERHVLLRCPGSLAPVQCHKSEGMRYAMRGIRPIA